MAVWTLILQSEPEGPALISCAARLLRSDSTFANLLLAPSWRTDFGHLKGDITAVAHDLRVDLDQLFLDDQFMARSNTQILFGENFRLARAAP